VCMTLNTLQPYEYYLYGFNKLTSFISDFLKLLTVLSLVSNCSKVWSKKEKMSCNTIIT
jgi:hypothetical protein